MPLKTILVDVPLQMVAVPLMAAVGKAFTVTMAEPVAGFKQISAPLVVMLTRL